MSQNGLIERILSDAEQTATSIVEKATAQAVESVKKANEDADFARQANDTRVKKECDDILSRRKTLAQIDAKKVVLSYKIKCADAAFDRALKMLCDTDSKKYTEMLVGLLEKYAEQGDVVTLSKDGKADVTALKNSKVFAQKQLTIDDETGDFVGGIVLKNKKYDKSLTFKDLLDEQKGEILGEVLSRLI